MKTTIFRLPVFTSIFIVLYMASIGSVLAAPEKEEKTEEKDPVDEVYKEFQDCLMTGELTTSNDDMLKCCENGTCVSIDAADTIPPYDPTPLKRGSSTLQSQAPAVGVLAPTIPPTTNPFPPNPTPEIPPVPTKPLVAPVRGQSQAPTAIRMPAATMQTSPTINRAPASTTGSSKGLSEATRTTTKPPIMERQDMGNKALAPTTSTKAIEESPSEGYTPIGSPESSNRMETVK